MEHKKWLLYRHTSPSGKVYIGITSRDVNKRWSNGFGYKLCKLFFRAILKYGWDNIKHEILFTNLEESRAKILEIELIRHYKSLGISYNITNGGDGMSGYTPTEETLMKIRKSLKGRTSPNKGKLMKDSTKLILRERSLGRKVSEDTRSKISIAMSGANHPFYGKHLTTEHKIRISNSHTGIKLGNNISFEKRSKGRDNYCKVVEQLDLDNNIIASFRSAIDAARYYGKGKSTASKITECCRGSRNKTLNYKWRYKNVE